jgi:hypothetical protein
LAHSRATALKKILRASEHDRPDVKQAREEWIGVRQAKMRLEPHRLVFLDETGTTTKVTRLRGRCPKGRRLLSKAPFGHWKTQTFIAGLRCDALTAPFVIDASMDVNDHRNGTLDSHGGMQISPAKSATSSVHKNAEATSPPPDTDSHDDPPL